AKYPWWRQQVVFHFLEVGGADTATLHFDQDFAPAQCRARNALHLHPAFARVDCRFHFTWYRHAHLSHSLRSPERVQPTRHRDSLKKASPRWQDGSIAASAARDGKEPAPGRSLSARNHPPGWRAQNRSPYPRRKGLIPLLRKRIAGPVSG